MYRKNFQHAQKLLKHFCNQHRKPKIYILKKKAWPNSKYIQYNNVVRDQVTRHDTQLIFMILPDLPSSACHRPQTFEARAY